MESFKEFFDVALETLFPSGLVCFICGDEVQESKFELCNRCEKKIPLVKKHCLKCGSPIYSDELVLLLDCLFWLLLFVLISLNTSAPAIIQNIMNVIKININT